jgi:hypothetical protein
MRRCRSGQRLSTLTLPQVACAESPQAWLPRWHVHGSEGGLADLSNTCNLPAWTRSSSRPATAIIPRIFQITDVSVVTTHTLQGMARVRSGQVSAWPSVSDRRSPQRLQDQVRLRVYVDRCPSICAGCSAGTVALGLEGGHVHSAGHPRIQARPRRGLHL